MGLWSDCQVRFFCAHLLLLHLHSFIHDIFFSAIDCNIDLLDTLTLSVLVAKTARDLKKSPRKLLLAPSSALLILLLRVVLPMLTSTFLTDFWLEPILLSFLTRNFRSLSRVFAGLAPSQSDWYFQHRSRLLPAASFQRSQKRTRAIRPTCATFAALSSHVE